VENMSNPLHQILSEYLPQVNLTFSLGDLAGAIALIVSAVTFYVSHTRASQREQMNISRDIWTGINESIKPINEFIKTQKKDESGRYKIPSQLAWPYVRELDYFAYLILSREIKDRIVLGYYREHLSGYIDSFLSYYVDPDYLGSLYKQFKYFDRLIDEWRLYRPDQRKP
jgi:hypothetical protein